MSEMGKNLSLITLTFNLTNNTEYEWSQFQKKNI